ncbi:Integrase, catalytic core [Gossypium australe]|uniref:Integrase, catalytic core n=1 Tax=Gossypium australe TaxID=47621 RepID=A0A5B6VXA7_9ROSI|nr:Integrase, catalytic core [Gossypium australe]
MTCDDFDEVAMIVKQLDNKFYLKDLDLSLYRSVVGKLQNLTSTRLDITFCVNRASQNMIQPYEHHWYRLVARADVDWGSNLEDKMSILGYVVFFGGNLVAWRSNKQLVVSLATSEAEYQV